MGTSLRRVPELRRGHAGTAVSLGILFALLAIIAVMLQRKRVPRSGGGDSADRVDDDAIRRIEEVGRLELDEPIDLEHIREEENRFWEESSWEEPEEY